ncbi:MAG: glycosyltransferase [Ignavibacteriaceae bacterium]|nr:glycosyltransferase [Ignavibacteriaceae bacterium]
MKNISFVIIGRNEGWKLDVSLKSVFDTLLLNNIADVSEVIYVDSNSTDNSIEIAKKYPLTLIIKVTDKHINAAIGRNIGASYSKGDYLIFLDGDTQLIPKFISEIIDQDKTLKYSFVTGNIIEYYYDDKWKFIKKLYRTPNGKAYLRDKYEAKIGGVFFCVKRSLWDELHGMDSRLNRLEDTDFSLRLSQKGIPLLRKKEVAAIHHTISYVYHARLKKELLSFDSKYYGHLYHMNLFNLKLIKIIIRSEFTLLLFLFMFLLSFYIGAFWPIILYPLFVLIRVWYQSRRRFFSALDVLHIIKRDIIVFFSFLFYFPVKRNIDPQCSIVYDNNANV